MSPLPGSAAAADPVCELRALAAAVRSHLGWLREGGVGGLPRPAPTSRARVVVPSSSAAPGAPAPAARPSSPQVADHAMPPRHYAEPASEADAGDAASAARAALQASARAASVSVRPSADPYGSARAEGSAKPAPVSLQSPASLPQYPGLDDPRLITLPGQEALAEIRQILGDCRRCNLCHGRTNIVFGDGDPQPWLVFVGEGPGADEDRLGLPFVGAAGDLLNKMIKAMGDEAGKRGHAELRDHLARERVYIANVVKCRPPGNRTPESDEIAACTPVLHAQLRSLKPRIIVALGRTPAQYLLQTSASLGQLRGRFSQWNGIPVMPTYHPAYLLRTPSAKQQVWDDLKLVIEQLSHPPAIPINS